MTAVVAPPNIAKVSPGTRDARFSPDFDAKRAKKPAIPAGFFAQGFRTDRWRRGLEVVVLFGGELAERDVAVHGGDVDLGATAIQRSAYELAASHGRN